MKPEISVIGRFFLILGILLLAGGLIADENCLRHIKGKWKYECSED